MRRKGTLDIEPSFFIQETVGNAQCSMKLKSTTTGSFAFRQERIAQKLREGKNHQQETR